MLYVGFLGLTKPPPPMLFLVPPKDEEEEDLEREEEEPYCCLGYEEDPAPVLVFLLAQPPLRLGWALLELLLSHPAQCFVTRVSVKLTFFPSRLF